MAEENKSEQKTSVPPEAQDKLQSSKEHARRAAEDLKSAAGAFAGEYPRQGRAGLGRGTRQSRTSMGGCKGSRPHIPGRRRAIRA